MRLRVVSMHLLPLLLVGCSDAGVKAFNASPEALISTPASGDRPPAGVAVPLRGVVSDPDGGPDGLQATWLVDGVVACEAASPDAEAGGGNVIGR